MIAARHCTTAALGALLRDQPLSPGKVSLAWRIAVGDAIDRVTHVALDPDGALTVTAADPQWARELRRSIPLIKTRLNRMLGDVVTRMEVSGRTTREEKQSHARVGHR
jgi:predicted nucleic acid-binding Zn ribbon protein